MLVLKCGFSKVKCFRCLCSFCCAVHIYVYNLQQSQLERTCLASVNPSPSLRRCAFCEFSCTQTLSRHSRRDLDGECCPPLPTSLLPSAPLLPCPPKNLHCWSRLQQVICGRCNALVVSQSTRSLPTRSKGVANFNGCQHCQELSEPCSLE